MSEQKQPKDEPKEVAGIPQKQFTIQQMLPPDTRIEHAVTATPIPGFERWISERKSQPPANP
jgi:hypothetical protein